MLVHVCSLIISFSLCVYGNLKEIESLYADHSQLRALEGWSDDLTQMRYRASESGKPQLIAFLGRGKCPWSEKFEEEILTSSEFSSKLRSKVLLSFCDLGQSNAELWQKRYAVEEFPLLLIVDAQDKEIARIGYLPLSADEFASRILAALDLAEQISKEETQQLSTKELEQLYLKAKQLPSETLRQKILAMGLKKKGLFFQVEKYGDVSKEDVDKSIELGSLRKEIVAQDPQHHFGARLSLAIFDFEALIRSGVKKGRMPTAPLEEYLARFGSLDLSHSWRAEILLAQYYFSKNKLQKALEFAKASHAHAPEEFKADVAKAIQYLSKE